MPELDADVKTFIIKRLACYEKPSVVVKAVKEEFDVEVTRQAVHANDPTSVLGSKSMGDRWKKVFEETRAKFLEATDHIAISHKPVRLSYLQRMADNAERSGNMVLAASLLEQAAKEMGEQYSNRHKVDHGLQEGNPLAELLAKASGKTIGPSGTRD